MGESYRASAAPQGPTREPFSLAVNDGGFFRDPGRMSLLGAMSQAVREHDALVLVRGARGVGKTSILDQFLGRLDPAWRVSVINGPETPNGVQLLTDICRDFELEIFTDDYRIRFEKLLARLRRLQAAGGIFLLAIDDCHKLRDSAFKTLLYLYRQQGERGRLLRLVLLGEPTPPGAAPAACLAQMVGAATHRFEIPRFDEAQTAAYIAHRLSAAGLKRQRPFTKRDLKKVHELGQGLPGEIDRAAAAVLQPIPSGAPAPPRKRGRSRRAFSGAALLAALAAAAHWFPDRKAPGTEAAVQSASPGALGATFAAATDPESPWAAAASSSRRDSGRAAAPYASGKQEPDAGSSAASDHQGTDALLPASGTVNCRGPGLPLARDAWLLKQDPRSYTVMLLGARRRETVARYIAAQELGDPACYFATRWQGGSWFGLLYGIYPDRSTARAAARSLSGLPEVGPPWVRSLASVQRDIHELR